MPYPNFHTARMEEPDKFAELRMLKELENGIQIYGGSLKDEDIVKIQSFRFPKDKFSVELSKEWLSKQGKKPSLFEPASDDKKAGDGKKDDAPDKETKKDMSTVTDVFNGDTTTVKNIEIFNLFKNSHNLKFTERDLEDIVELGNKNILSKKVVPNVGVSHSDEQLMLKELLGKKTSPYEELPNLGLLSNLRKEGKAIFCDITDVPKKLKEFLFSGKYFRSISPEVVMNWRDTGKKFIKRIVLTNKPSLMHISDVHMSKALEYGGNLIIEEDNMSKQNDDKSKDVPAMDESFAQKIVTGITEFFSKKEKEDKSIDITPVEDKKEDKNQVVPLSQVVELKTSFENQINDLKKQLVDKDEEQKKFFSDLETLKADTKKKTAEAICSKAINSGVPKNVVEYWKPVLMSKASEEVILLTKKVDEEEVEIKRPISEYIEKFFEICPGKVDFSDLTSTDVEHFSRENDRKSKIDERAAEIQKAEGLDRHEALMKAGEELA